MFTHCRLILIFTKKVVNNHNETFQKASVIIANHTSFLDTLAIGMLNPKIIFLVNDWVYNSPFFGRAVKLAGFYPVSQGVEGSVEHLREKVEQGFSLMVFPEGSRAEDGTIQRFHKGAFYLAEHFNLDVLPVYIHGNSDVLPKGDHIIYNGKITVIIGERIEAEDRSFGISYSERTKKINAYFRGQFALLRKEFEDENYFKSKLFLSFLYKELEIIKEVKEDFEIRKAIYFNLNKYIKADAKILHIANDYGQLDVLLALQQSKRKISTFIEDEEKRAVASTNYLLKKRKIVYLDLLSNDNKADILLISADFDSQKNTELINDVQQIILLHQLELKHHFRSHGFEIDVEEQDFLILKK